MNSKKELKTENKNEGRDVNFLCSDTNIRIGLAIQMSLPDRKIFPIDSSFVIHTSVTIGFQIRVPNELKDPISRMNIESF